MPSASCASATASSPATSGSGKGMGDWWIGGLLDCWIAGLLDCWIAGLLDCWIAELVDCWIAGLLDCWIAGLLDCWIAGLLDCWIVGLLDWWIGGLVDWCFVGLVDCEFCDFMEYTQRRNLNRGYMKLEAWQRGLDLFALAYQLSKEVGDFKIKSQFRDAAQSVSANIAEGYGRRSLPEYIQFLYVAKGSLAETLTKGIGLQTVKLMSKLEFESLDQLHYEVENKLLRLIESLENKRTTNDWRDTLPPSIQKSSIPPIESQPQRPSATRPLPQQSNNP